MERAEFEALVARMEALERANPGAYRRRVLAWAAMGYGYLLLVVLGLLALCAGLVLSFTYLKWLAAKLLFVVVPGLFVLVRALWVRFDPPEGERVTRQDAPALFALLDSLRDQLSTPRVHEVVVTEELNAAVTQVPRLGFLGWHRNFLLLGLPLMKGLTVEQFKAVLAHELGHLSHGHARVANWIYRLRQIWSRLDHEFSQQAQVGAGIIRRFFNWYVPRFNATSFPLARANEFEADAASVRLTSASAAAQALTGINVLARYLDQNYWPSIHSKAKEQAQPTFAPYSRFAGNAVLEVPPAERARWQSEALARATSYADTHPSLTDRLAAIGAPADFVPPGAGQGAETLLGSLVVDLERKFDAAWRERVAASWREFHEDTQKAQIRLAELRGLAGTEAQDEDMLLEWASLEERLGGGPDRALALRREAHARFPESTVARFVLGRQLLQARNAEGLALMQAVIEKDPALEVHGAQLLRDYFWSLGEKEAADQWHDRHLALMQKMQEAHRERDTLLTSDTFLPHELGAGALELLREQLRSVPHLRRAYLVRKYVRHFADQPFYVLGFVCAGRFQRSDEYKTAAALQDIRTKVQFPGETIIVSLEKSNREFESMFKWVDGARIV